MDITEKKLIELSVGGDIEAFETLIQSHQKRVYNIALRMTKNPEDAQELAQDALVRAFTSISKFRGDSSFSTWLYRITVNVCTDFLRKRNRVIHISVEQGAAANDNEQGLQIAEDSPGPDELAEKKQLKKLVRDAMDSLSDDHRQVIILRDIMHMSYKEISDALNVNEGTVKSRINRARGELKKIIMQRTELFKDYVVKANRKGGNS